MQSHEGGTVTLSESAYDYQMLEIWRYYRHTDGYRPELVTQQRQLFPGSDHVLASAESVVVSTYNMTLEASLGVAIGEDGRTVTLTPRMRNGYSSLWLVMGHLRK